MKDYTVEVGGTRTRDIPECEVDKLHAKRTLMTRSIMEYVTPEESVTSLKPYRRPQQIVYIYFYNPCQHIYHS